MRSRRSRWLSGIGAAVLVGGLVLANYGGGAQGAPGNPFTDVIAKLDQILAALTTASGENNHTLRWDTHNPPASRFTTAFPGAVLDKNTGLVWEQAPDGTPFSWVGATAFCVRRDVGGTVGWRLPSVVELNSVRDPSSSPPYVPASAFTISTSNATPGVQSAFYWSATSEAATPVFAWGVNFGAGLVNGGFKATTGSHAWCVRGGMPADQY